MQHTLHSRASELAGLCTEWASSPNSQSIDSRQSKSCRHQTITYVQTGAARRGTQGKHSHSLAAHTRSQVPKPRKLASLT